MSKDSPEKTYQIKLTGGGLTLDRPIPEAVATSIINLIMSGSTPAGSTSQTSAAPFAQTIAGVAAPQSTGTPKAFLASKRPNSEIQRIACLAYYLTHARQTPTFKTAEVTKLNTEAALSKINVGRAVDNANKAFFLSPAGKGQKQITTRGEALVEALPDQAKAKEALNAQPGSKRKLGKKKAKSTKK